MGRCLPRASTERNGVAAPSAGLTLKEATERVRAASGIELHVPEGWRRTGSRQMSPAMTGQRTEAAPRRYSTLEVGRGQMNLRQSGS